MTWANFARHFWNHWTGSCSRKWLYLSALFQIHNIEWGSSISLFGLEYEYCEKSDRRPDTGAANPAYRGSTFNLASSVPECAESYDPLSLIMLSVKQIAIHITARSITTYDKLMLQCTSSDSNTTTTTFTATTLLPSSLFLPNHLYYYHKY